MDSLPPSAGFQNPKGRKSKVCSFVNHKRGTVNWTWIMPIGDGCSKGPASTYFGKISLWNENWIKLKISVWWTWTTSCNLNDIKARQGAEIIEIYSIPFKTFLCLIFGQFRWTCHQSHRYPYQVLLTTMRDELYCTPSSRIVNIDYETPMEHKVGAHIQWQLYQFV